MGMLEKNAWDARVDILLISEPSKKMIEKAQWFKDRKGDAAIRRYGRKAVIGGDFNAPSPMWGASIEQRAEDVGMDSPKSSGYP
jgi:hypothetical protein